MPGPLMPYVPLILVAACLPGPNPTSGPSHKPRVAVFTFCGGARHEVLPLAERTLRELADKSETFEVTALELYKHESGKIDLSGFFDAAFFKRFDAVIFYTTTGEKDKDLLTDKQRSALIDAVRGGMPFIGIHSAADSFYNWPEYGEMLGAYFDGHPWAADAAPVTIKIEDRDHPSCAALGAMWYVQEEIYQFRAPYDRTKLNILMSLDTSATDMSVGGIKRADRDFALAWTKYFGRGRVFYTALGHREDVWRDELFRQHLVGGIRWALGQVPGKPLPAGSVEEQFKTLPNGIQYRDLIVGEGASAARLSEIKVHYTGWLMDGTKVDSSIDRGQPMEFKLGVGAVIAGWDEGLLGMKMGGKRKLIIPPDLGYGMRGAGDKIPPNAKLIFEVELLEVK